MVYSFRVSAPLFGFQRLTPTDNLNGYERRVNSLLPSIIDEKQVESCSITC